MKVHFIVNYNPLTVASTFKLFFIQVNKYEEIVFYLNLIYFFNYINLKPFMFYLKIYNDDILCDFYFKNNI